MILMVTVTASRRFEHLQRDFDQSSCIYGYHQYPTQNCGDSIGKNPLTPPPSAISGKRRRHLPSHWPTSGRVQTHISPIVSLRYGIYVLACRFLGSESCVFSPCIFYVPSHFSTTDHRSRIRCPRVSRTVHRHLSAHHLAHRIDRPLTLAHVLAAVTMDIGFRMHIATPAPTSRHMSYLQFTRPLE